MTSTIRASGGLPAAITSFVGRQQETAEVRRLLGAARLVTLTGAGGVGKTRLALEVAAASARAFSGGVRLVDLAQAREPAAVAEVAAAALGVADQGMRPVLELLTAHVAGRRMLVVLDNCEHLVEACAQLAQCLLSAAPEMRILATSRETLGLTGEHVFAVAPLARAEAVELLVQRTAAVRPGFRLTDVNRPAVDRLCADLDGLPLAIELAASRLRTLSVEQAVERLEERFGLLTSGSRGARPHQRTLRAALDWSWELCGPKERLLWSRLSVFAGGFTLEAAEGVCAGEGFIVGEVLDALDRLVAQSLVEHDGSERLPRYRLLESIRHYGRERLTDSGEVERALRRHRDFYLALAERLHQDWFGPAQVEILDRLRADHGNLLAALEHPEEGAEGQPCTDDDHRPEPDAAGRGGNVPAPGQVRLRLASALVYYWIAGGLLSEGRRQLERALAGPAEPTRERARAYVEAAYITQTQCDLAAADRFLEGAEELAGRLGNPALRAHAQGHRGVSHMYRGRLEEAASCMEQTVARYIALGDRFGEVTWGCALGIVQTLGGDPRAQRTSAQALDAAEAHGERWARAHLLTVLGRRAWGLGDQDHAAKLTVAALESLRGFSDTAAVAKMVEQLAWITASAGQHQRAARLLGAAQSLRQDAGTPVTAGDPRDEEHHVHCHAQVRQSLGQAGYERALTEGTAVDGPGQAIAHALDTPTGSAAGALPAAASPLTAREEQVAALIAQGMTNRRIAAELVLSPRTVDNHVDRIRTKLGFSSRAQVAAWWAAH
ncbi:ATP-binding protein [Streptomyces caniscabiei]|uniref:ATP-binding protein n=2 Tax=Streptomyces caniscabiei TaxID=2746961 RepID=UPI00211B0019|nr:LuxR C-terminal-related transcriptional regulator [Streptomyces caniscabiei]